MAKIDVKDKKYIITFKRKDQRPNSRDDKFEIFRNVVGLEDVKDILDLSRYTQNHMTDTIRKTKETVTDINSFETPFVFARLTPDQVGRLRRDPNVSLVEEDATYYVAAEFPGWQIPKLQADQTWAAPLSVRGAGVNVAIIDTGVDPHLDINANLKVNQNFTLRPGTIPEDSVHHGTHVAGITGAVQGNNNGIAGVAPSCNIWNIRCGDNNGQFQGSDLVEGATFANLNNAHVLNMSISGGPFMPAFADTLTALFNKGCVILGANGNTGKQETATYPASYAGVIGISNLHNNNLPHPSSTFGTMTDFTAPGGDIESLAENNGYRTLSGTSMATPAASGVAALMLSAYNDTGCPPYSPGAQKNVVIESVMKNTATKTGLTGAGPLGQRDIFYGYGLFQTRVAVASLKGVLPSALA